MTQEATTKIEDQPAPVVRSNNLPSMHDLIIGDLRSYELVAKDMEERKQIGLQRYGTTLQVFNGRNAEIDAYQELLDFLAYIKQVLMEGKIEYEGTYKTALILAVEMRRRIETDH